MSTPLGAGRMGGYSCGYVKRTSLFFGARVYRGEAFGCRACGEHSFGHRARGGD